MDKTQQLKIKELADLWGLDFADAKGMIETFMRSDSSTIEEIYAEMTGKEDVKIVSLLEAASQQEKSEKVPIGFPALDEPMGGGMSRGSSMVIAAPSGEGKTQFMVSLSYHFLKNNHPCLWFSYEENIADLWERFKLTGIDENIPAFCPLDITDNKLNFIERVIRKFKKEHEFFIVFIDQLSFLAPKIKERTEVDHVQGNYSMYLGLISNQIKEIAMEHQIIIIFAHQLGRTGDVAYSDMIKHAPDKVIYLKREPNTDSHSKEEFTEKTFVIFKKNRPYGSRPRLAMTVKDGLFTPLTDLVEYAEKKMGWKKVDENFNY